MSSENEKLYLYKNDQGLFCFSNTVAVLVYTFVSFASICICIVARQIVYTKRNQSVYMDHKFKPENSEEEDEVEEKSAALGENHQTITKNES